MYNSTSSTSSPESEDSSENENEKNKANGTNGVSKDSLHETSDPSSSAEEVSDEDSKVRNITNNQEQDSSDSNSSNESESEEENEDADIFVKNSSEDGNSKFNNLVSKSNSSKRKLDDPNPNSFKKTKVDENSSKSKTVFVGQLSSNVDPEWLRKEFEGAGEIIDIRIVYNRDTGKSKGFGYVEFSTTEGASNALKFAGKTIDGRAINVDFADQKSSHFNKNISLSRGTSEISNTIFIGNLSFNVTENDIWEAFGNYGQVVSVRIPTYEDSGKLRGFGYVEFTDTNAAQKAMELHGTEICGRAIRLDFTDGKPRGNNSSPGSHGKRRGSNDRGGRGGRGRRDGRGGRGGFGRSGFNTAAAANRGAIVPAQGNKITFD